MPSISKRDSSYTYFIGIDISKNKLDYTVLNRDQILFHRVDKNDPAAITSFVRELKKLSGFKLSKAIFCMENTGHYGNHLLYSLNKLRAKLVVENALKMKNSFGFAREKNDKIDSQRIAQYAYRHRFELKFWQPRRPILLQLANLISLRERLIKTLVALKNGIREQDSFLEKKLSKKASLACKESICAMTADIARLEVDIIAAVKSDERLNDLFQIISSVVGIGPVTSVQMILCTNEFLDITDPKKFACYAGVAPFVKESGIFKGKARVSNIANKRMKSLLHLCAMVAMRNDQHLITYYERKTKTEGKPAMSVINAIRYKLILRVFACVKENRTYKRTPLAFKIQQQAEPQMDEG